MSASPCQTRKRPCRLFTIHQQKRGKGQHVWWYGVHQCPWHCLLAYVWLYHRHGGILLASSLKTPRPPTPLSNMSPVSLRKLFSAYISKQYVWELLAAIFVLHYVPQNHIIKSFLVHIPKYSLFDQIDPQQVFLGCTQFILGCKLIW